MSPTQEYSPRISCPVSRHLKFSDWLLPLDYWHVNRGRRHTNSSTFYFFGFCCCYCCLGVQDSSYRIYRGRTNEPLLVTTHTVRPHRRGGRRQRRPVHELNKKFRIEFAKLSGLLQISTAVGVGTSYLPQSSVIDSFETVVRSLLYCDMFRFRICGWWGGLVCGVGEVLC